jgi:hypothetical protein
MKEKITKWLLFLIIITAGLWLYLFAKLYGYWIIAYLAGLAEMAGLNTWANHYY